MEDLISRQDAIDVVMEYGKKIPPYAIRCKQALKDLPSAEPKTPSSGSITCVKSEKMHDRTMSDLISRQDAKDAIDMALDHIDHVPPWVYDKLLNALNEVPSAEKAQLSGEDATSGLISRKEAQECQRVAQKRRYTFGNDEFSLEAAYHDCKLVFDGITDDDSFQEADTGLILYYANEIIYALQETLEGKGTNALCNDTVSRQAAIDALVNSVSEIGLHDNSEVARYGATFRQHEIIDIIEGLPSAQPERTCVNCGRTVNNGGWYADGRTRCPIEEHYALPKDGYCHLWEERNVTDDDYPERREE